MLITETSIRVEFHKNCEQDNRVKNTMSDIYSCHLGRIRENTGDFVEKGEIKKRQKVTKNGKFVEKKKNL